MKDINTFPSQKLPMSKKTKAWKEACVDYIANNSIAQMGINGRTKQEEMQTYYDLYNSIYNEKDLKYVTNPFKQNDGFPATAQDYNIIKPKVDLLLGEETKRPFTFKVCRTSDIAASDAQDQAKQLLDQYVMAAIQAKMSPENQQKFQEGLQSGDIQTPEQIAKYMTQDYKDIAESTAYHTLQYLTKKLNIPHQFFKGFKDALIGGEEIYYIGVRNGNPCVDHINPIYFNYETSSDLEFIQDASWCCYKMNLSATDIYDRFYDKMTEKDLNELLEIIEDKPGSGIDMPIRKTSMDFPHYKFKNINTYDGRLFDSNHIDVWHCCWKSFKRIGFVTTFNQETQQPEEIQVDETYVETGNELSIEWRWIIEVWEGYRIGDDMYIGIQPLEYQYVSADNLNSQYLPYTGAVYNNTNTQSRSLVSMMKPLQYMYIVIWYRLELALARDKGKVLTMDITQIPKSMNIDVNKWMHYLSALGVNFINPYEEGWDIPGRDGSHPSPFNQIASVDLTMANVIAQYIQLMDKIESMVSEITGVTKQREGAISSSELVGNVERSVTQSAHITEAWFWTHDQVKKQVLTMLLNTAKAAWRNTNKKNLQYILDDETRAFFSLNDDFFYEDMDVFVDDSTKNQQELESLKNLMQPAMQNGAGLLDIAEIITLDNVNMIKNKLQEIESKHEQQAQQQSELEQQHQQELIQMQNEVKDRELMIKEAELDMAKYKIDMDNQTRIAVAEMQAYRGARDMDANDNGIPDVMEIGKQALEQQKINSDSSTKQLELANKRREIETKKEIEDKKLSLEKQKLETQKQLQQMADDAAMNREKLKAETALKNKVVGENKSK